jgi:hypothetical protein
MFVLEPSIYAARGGEIKAFLSILKFMELNTYNLKVAPSLYSFLIMHFCSHFQKQKENMHNRTFESFHIKLAVAARKCVILKNVIVHCM